MLEDTMMSDSINKNSSRVGPLEQIISSDIESDKEYIPLRPKKEEQMMAT